MKTFLISAGTALALSLAALAPSAALADGRNGSGQHHRSDQWQKHGHNQGHGQWNKHGGRGWQHRPHAYGWGPKRGYVYAGRPCRRVPVTVFTAYGPVVKIVSSCRAYY